MKKAGFMEKNQIQDKERRIRTVADSRTEQVHLIMHQHLNAGGRLFGGMLMQWADEVASVVAMRHAGTNRVTTAAIDNLQFKEATYEGELLVLIGYVTCVGNTSMEVEIDTYVERSDGMRYSVHFLSWWQWTKTSILCRYRGLRFVLRQKRADMRQGSLGKTCGRTV